VPAGARVVPAGRGFDGAAMMHTGPVSGLSPDRPPAPSGSRFTIPVSVGPLVIELRDSRERGVWRFDVASPTELLVDLLDPRLCRVEGAEAVEVRLPDGYVPTPRLRLAVNGVVHELVCSDERVLQRHYSRPHHQDLYVSSDPWIEAYHAARVRQARRLLHGVRGRVCDVGSGYSLVQAAGPWTFQLSACDRDPEAIAALRRSGVDAVCAPADDPPFAAGSFDAVFAGEILEHLADPETALRRWIELLRPDGRLVVTTPNRRHLLTRVRRHELVENPEHLFEWDLHQLRRGLTGAGAAVDHVEGLAVPVPVYVPRHGWRDLTGAAVRRVPVRRRWVVAVIEAGRWTPGLAVNLAAVAHRLR